MTISFPYFQTKINVFLLSTVLLLSFATFRLLTQQPIEFSTMHMRPSAMQPVPKISAADYALPENQFTITVGGIPAPLPFPNIDDQPIRTIQTIPECDDWKVSVVNRVKTTLPFNWGRKEISGIDFDNALSSVIDQATQQGYQSLEFIAADGWRLVVPVDAQLLLSPSMRNVKTEGDTPYELFAYSDGGGRYLDMVTGVAASNNTRYGMQQPSFDGTLQNYSLQSL